MIQPTKHRVLIQRDSVKTETETGLFIPKEAQEVETQGTILAVGPTADDTLKVGQVVLFGRHDGTLVDSNYCDNRENCWMIADTQIRCILNA